MNTAGNQWNDGYGQTPSWARPYPTAGAGQGAAYGAGQSTAQSAPTGMPGTAGPDWTPYSYTGTRTVSRKKDRATAGVIAIILGGLGIHKFYMGYTHAGLLMLLLSVFTVGKIAALVHIVGIIEGVIYLTMSDEKFQETYIRGDKKWF